MNWVGITSTILVAFCTKLEFGSYDHTTLRLIWEFFICKNVKTKWTIFNHYLLWLCVT